ncbi:hypothetical protein [Nocardioides albus]|uniref:Uncharacterized protein n=1 Tax=Nocardioides albus TaxID=1841 RepID=A0A7W5FBB7_9ACTN|nr:hypothetical protein [Nocardioides albus]MBB3092168.1 hypothetical protein [Nocardioides albus]
MGQIAGRRHSAVPLTARTSARLQESTKAKADAIADTLGVSLWTYVDALIARDELDEAGKPIWWTGQPGKEEELFPMTG